MTALFPFILTALFILSGVVYCLDRRFNEALYSFAAALLQVAVYFKPFH